MRHVCLDVCIVSLKYFISCWDVDGWCRLSSGIVSKNSSKTFSSLLTAGPSFFTLIDRIDCGYKVSYQQEKSNQRNLRRKISWKNAPTSTAFKEMIKLKPSKHAASCIPRVKSVMLMRGETDFSNVNKSLRNSEQFWTIYLMIGTNYFVTNILNDHLTTSFTARISFTIDKLTPVL